MKFPPHLVQRHTQTPLGTLLLLASDAGLAMAWFEDHEQVPLALRHAPHAAAEHPVLRHATRQIKEYFDGRRTRFDLPLDLSSGTAFQQAVWQDLLTLPFGHTCSYGDVAARIARPTAVRAVGAAVGANPIGIIVPCHRVIGANGALTGYAAGLDRKTYLLQLEGGLDPQRSLL
jgi:methylated-DNA-[protein]-cysteine S-methyltransferase